MQTTPIFDIQLVRRYDTAGPRYTSYPTAPQFTRSFGEAEYREAAVRSNASGAALSVYIHLPFCSSPCYYCGCLRIVTRKRDDASAYLDRLTTEIRMQGALFDRTRIVEQLHLGGGTPTYYLADELARLMAALRDTLTLRSDGTQEFSVEMDPRTAQAGTIGSLAELGFNRISLGVQDFDPDVQRAVNREQSVEQTADLIRQSRASGFRSVSVDLIYGLPLQTPESFDKTLALVIGMRPDRIAAYSYAHLPERFKAQRQIRVQDLPTPETKLALLQLTVEKLTTAGYVYIGMDHFALPDDELAVAQRAGTLHRNFQGYSTRSGLDLIGLGLSAIGKIGDSYSQNVKSIPDYGHLLDAGQLPIERGLQLNEDDRLRRRAIELIMCHGEIDMDAFSRSHGIDFAEYFSDSLQRLQPAARDGLVRIDASHLHVTPQGRLLLRAIAMAFDRYLHDPAATQVRHSKVI